MIVIVTFIFTLMCVIVFTLNKQTNLWLLIESQKLQIKIVVEISGPALDTVLQFAFEILFSTDGHINQDFFLLGFYKNGPQSSASGQKGTVNLSKIGPHRNQLAEKTAGKTSGSLPISFHSNFEEFN